MMNNCPHCKKEIKEEHISEWSIINAQIKRSKIFRINWKELFGKTLTKKVSELYAKGYTNKEAYQALSNELAWKGISARKYYENLKIGVAARFGEIKSESNEIKKVKGK